MIRRREVVAPYPLRRQESLPGGRALRCVVEFPCREVLAAEDQEDGPGEAIEAIRHTLRKRPRALPGRARAAGDREALGEQLSEGARRCHRVHLAPDGALPDAPISQPHQAVVPQIGAGPTSRTYDPVLYQLAPRQEPH